MHTCQPWATDILHTVYQGLHELHAGMQGNAQLISLVKACRGFSHDLQHAVASETHVFALLQQDLFMVTQHGTVRQTYTATMER